MSDDELKIGPTGAFPRGKLSPDDKGELAVAISTMGEYVRIDFGTPVDWVCLPPDQALAFASTIAAKARAMKGWQPPPPWPPRP